MGSRQPLLQTCNTATLHTERQRCVWLNNDECREAVECENRAGGMPGEGSRGRRRRRGSPLHTHTHIHIHTDRLLLLLMLSVNPCVQCMAGGAPGRGFGARRRSVCARKHRTARASDGCRFTCRQPRAAPGHRGHPGPDAGKARLLELE